MTLTALTEFLLARIAEDHVLASAVYDHDRWIAEADGNGDEWVTEVDRSDQHWRVAMLSRVGHAQHIARHDPARVLAECEAKRRIVGWLSDALEIREAAEADSDQTWGGHQHLNALGLCVQAHAAAYADHPDYDEAWGLA